MLMNLIAEGRSSPPSMKPESRAMRRAGLREYSSLGSVAINNRWVRVRKKQTKPAAMLIWTPFKEKNVYQWVASDFEVIPITGMSEANYIQFKIPSRWSAWPDFTHCLFLTPSSIEKTISVFKKMCPVQSLWLSLCRLSPTSCAKVELPLPQGFSTFLTSQHA